MQIFHNVADLRAALRGRSQAVLVPTMGNLHEGHLSLVRLAAAHRGPVVASIFVNRLQFAPHEDFARYPRTLARDCDLLEGAGCEVVFAPDEQDLYPEPQTYRVQPPPALADILEGHFRPGFFVGVCTVVLKLFNVVAPRAAIFGKKDYQQLLVVRGMVRQCALPIDIIAGETVREPGGLALSSRNHYLPAQRYAEAATLHREIQGIADAVRGGRQDFAHLETTAMRSLGARGWSPDYIAVRRRDDLDLPVPGQPLVVLAAARLDQVRLIDNIEI